MYKSLAPVLKLCTSNIQLQSHHIKVQVSYENKLFSQCSKGCPLLGNILNCTKKFNYSEL